MALSLDQLASDEWRNETREARKKKSTKQTPLPGVVEQRNLSIGQKWGKMKKTAAKLWRWELKLNQAEQEETVEDKRDANLHID